MKKTIKDTYVFKVLDLASTVENCSKVNSDLGKYALDKDIVDAICNDIKFKVTFPSRQMIIDEIKADKITFVDTEFVRNIPTWMISNDGVSIKTAVVNLFGKIKVKDDGTAQFNSREIFALSIIAVAVREFYLKEAKILNNIQLTKYALVIYERMMYKVLDVLYSLDVAPIWLRTYVRADLRIFAAYYLLEKKFESTSNYDNIYNFIIKDLLPDGTDPTQFLARLGGQTFNATKYSSLEEYLKNLSSYNPILKDLDITAFLRKFVLMYGEKALLMIENYQYFLAYILSVTLSGNIVKDFAFEGPVGKEGVLLYNTFFDLIR